MENICFRDKDAQYYNFEKPRLISLIPEGPHVVLDLGCAAGRVGRSLRKLNKASRVVGVEIYSPAAEEAKKYYDVVYHGDIESLNLEYRAYFDYVICGDILEHLRDPWTMIARIRNWLNDSGHLIASIPNVRYWRVVRDLLVLGKWKYVEAGILDNTHLRFFTRRSFLEILEKANFKITHQEMIVNGKKQNLFNSITFGIFEELMGSQVMVLAKKIS